ncbi:iron-containing redox enzyme family protein [Streptacidiphilus neutrinimicus]|uniref:iron-containing redox enzyme family protein n=1 Tax=Streptacidiphilus neutrinimicus TaxID=105420 RepID=UPI0005AA1E2E|nr:iron-containing redox enzyme family protein [Streptacidiphilus neutrinimicus]
MGIEGAAPKPPAPRGPYSAALLRQLTEPPGPAVGLPRPPSAQILGDDLQLALYVCYELHYRGFDEVDPDWEWNPALLAFRAELEQAFLSALRAATTPAPLAEQLAALLTEPADGSGPSHFLRKSGERWQAREYLAQRSLYHLKEADPQAWAIPRLHGPAQAAFAAIEFDEYGDGHGDRAHAKLFADMMRDFGLDPGYGRYLDLASAEALAVVNLMSLFGLHRGLRGALVGQFAGVEITSSPGSARLADALESLGAGAAGTRFYREHVEADAVHEQLVRRGVIAELLRQEPGLEPDIAFGLAASTLLEERLAAHMVSNWSRGQSSLRGPLPAEVAGR